MPENINNKRNYSVINFKITKDKIILFSKATGQTDPVYFDEEHAKKLGLPSLLAPPTFLTVVEHSQNFTEQYIADLGISFSKIIHAGQSYNYYQPVYANDTITLKGKILDIYTKSNKSMQFVEFLSIYSNQKSVIVSKSLSTIVLM